MGGRPPSVTIGIVNRSVSPSMYETGPWPANKGLSRGPGDIGSLTRKNLEGFSHFPVTLLPLPYDASRGGLRLRRCRRLFGVLLTAVPTAVLTAFLLVVATAVA